MPRKALILGAAQIGFTGKAAALKRQMGPGVSWNSGPEQLAPGMDKTIVTMKNSYGTQLATTWHEPYREQFK